MSFVGRHLLRQSQVWKRSLRADGASDHMLKLVFALPDQTIYKNEPFHTVTIPSTSGVTGVSANQPPSIHQLAPGVVNLHKTATLDTKACEKFFVSGGFAVLDKGNRFSISAAEAIRLEDFDKDKVQKLYNEAKAKMESTAGKDPKEAALAGVEFKLYQSLLNAVN